MKLSAICSQVALLLFSKWDDPKSPYYRREDDKTKLVIPFGLHYNADGFIRYINNLEYEAVEGGHTRTDKALEIANNQVCYQQSLISFIFLLQRNASTIFFTPTHP